jgi:hypothetical protein
VNSGALVVANASDVAAARRDVTTALDALLLGMRLA